MSNENAFNTPIYIIINILYIKYQFDDEFIMNYINNIVLKISF